ncbi:hypothetical protein H0A71_21375 [Alcaligenaceae bacterium]|nr:hypothetical protein [Alcaligenaceae bacterium]
MADVVVRSHTIYANLRQDGAGIGRSTLYDSLDPTEKGATSYFLGMAMAKLFAAELFGTPWLFHVSQATSGGAGIVFNRGSKSQPDLIGQSLSGDWIVVEAKGRTNGLDGKALEKAKRQTEMIRTINGSLPTLRVALQAYFEDRLRVRIDDPTDAKPEALEVELDLNAALAKYYAVATAITARDPTIERVRDREFMTRVDNDSGVTIGLQSSVWESVKAGKFQDIRENSDRLDERMTGADGSANIYPDGLLVRLDARWSPQFMSREPELRDG